MTDQEKAEKLKEIFADKDFAVKVMSMETAEEVQAVVKEKGVELTIEEINQIQAQFLKAAENSEEISDDELENVAGGSLLLIPFLPMMPDLLHQMDSRIPGSRDISRALRRRW